MEIRQPLSSFTSSRADRYKNNRKTIEMKLQFRVYIIQIESTTSGKRIIPETPDKIAIYFWRYKAERFLKFANACERFRDFRFSILTRKIRIL